MSSLFKHESLQSEDSLYFSSSKKSKLEARVLKCQKKMYKKNKCKSVKRSPHICLLCGNTMSRGSKYFIERHARMHKNDPKYSEAVVVPVNNSQAMKYIPSTQKESKYR